MIIKKDGAISSSEKHGCKLKYFDVDDVIVSDALIKARGGFSSQYEKRSYTLELENKHTLAGLPIDDDWILNANYIDKTLMRHKISYDLFRQMNSSNVAAQCAYVTLQINDEKQGIYVLMQEINAAMLDLDRSDTMAVLFKDPPVFYSERLTEGQDPDNYYQQKYPKITTLDKTSYIVEFKDFLFDSDDESFAASIEDYIDIDNVLDWHLLLLFSNNGDGIMKNFYLYKTDSLSPFRIAIWDYDHSFGRDGDNELNMATAPLNWHKSVLLNRLVGIEETGYVEKLKERWSAYRAAGIFSYDSIATQIEKIQIQIAPSIDENFALWPVESHWYFDSNDHQQEIELMLNFIRFNINRLDDLFNDPSYPMIDLH